MWSIKIVKKCNKNILSSCLKVDSAFSFGYVQEVDRAT